MNSKDTAGDITGKLRKPVFKPVSEQTLVERLRNRASIRRNIPRAKEGEVDRISNDLEEAANRIEELERKLSGPLQTS